MIDVIYMILRRLRVPLIILIAVYAISIFGLAIAPGVDPDGNPWRMGFFHARRNARLFSYKYFSARA